MASPSLGPSAPPALLEVDGVHRDYDDQQVQALRGVTLRINEGEFVALMGASGSGKSTLLHLLGALDTPDAGEIRFRGEALRGLADPAAFRARNIGFVFQSFHLLPTLTAVENVQVPMFEMGWPLRERQRRAVALLALVGMSHRLDHLPKKLSGGERQRVAIARSLANEPGILLADEPTGNLDTASSAQIMQLLNQLHQEKGHTIILVTHDPAIARNADRLVTMRDGQVVSDEPLSKSAPGSHAS